MRVYEDHTRVYFTYPSTASGMSGVLMLSCVYPSLPANAQAPSSNALNTVSMSGAPT
jgi:hypothetical protein